MTTKAVSQLTDDELMLAHKAAAVELARKRADIAAHNKRMDMLNFVRKVFGNEIPIDLLKPVEAVPSNVEEQA